MFYGETDGNGRADRRGRTPTARWRERLIELLRQIRNALNGMGFHTAEDIFSDAYTSKMRDRPTEKSQHPQFDGFFANNEGQRAAFTDLGEFPVREGVPRGQQAQGRVLELGRETGREVMVAYTADGEVIAHGIGTESFLSLPPAMSEALQDPRQSIVIHHNHPTGTSISKQDIAMLAYPGMEAVWARGHDGTISRGQLTECAKDVLAALPLQDRVQKLHHIARRVGAITLDRLQTAVILDGLHPLEARYLDAYLVSEVLRRSGVIDYRHNIDQTALIEKLGTRSF